MIHVAPLYGVTMYAHIAISEDNIFRKVVKRDMNRCWCNELAI